MSITYLDHAATTPMSPVAVAAWQRAAGVVGNPSAVHAAGRAARGVVEDAREQVADGLGVRPSQVVFTGGGTEADNLAVLGIARARRRAQPRRVRVLVSALEHAAVNEAAASLARERFCVETLPVRRDGRLDADAAEAAIDTDSSSIALVSCLWVSNEVGTIEPVGELAALAVAHGIPLHSDAVQAVTYCPVRLDGLAALSVCAHKLGGPMGVGALVLADDVPIEAVGFGGGQERELRSGTVPVPLVAGFGAALAEAVAVREVEAVRLRGLSGRLIAGLEAGGLAQVVGPSDPALRSPHVVTVVVPGCQAADLLVLLDQAGVACSAGSACHAGVVRPNPALLAMGYDEVAAAASLRFSLGRTSAASDVDALLRVWPGVVARARIAGGV